MRQLFHTSTAYILTDVDSAVAGIPQDSDVSRPEITDAAGSTHPASLMPALLNVHATKGVIHVIDKVLIPDGILC